MINGNLQEFVNTLFTGRDLEVMLRGRHLFIQGYHANYGTPKQHAHMEMFGCDNMRDYDDFIWAKDGANLSELATEFMQAKVWDNMAFDEAEAEIEWI